jgi:deazaflavin-dependent oxidoreductase (nitroreductase family)
VCGRTDDGHVYIIASANGSPKHPAWFHNVVANPTVTVEVGTEKYEATARVADEPQRTELYQAMVERMPQFAGYQEGNPRTIPVVILEGD